MSLDKRFIPEELQSVDELYRLLDSKRLVDIAYYLKWARENLAKLDPLRFSIYTKFRANLLKKNVNISDTELLEGTAQEIAEKIAKSLHINMESANTVEPVEESNQELIENPINNNPNTGSKEVNISVKAPSPDTDEKANTETEIDNTKKESNSKEPNPEIVTKLEGHEFPKNEAEAVKDIVTADVGLVENERQQIRKAILNETIHVTVSKGSSFQIKMNKKGTHIDLILPNQWEIEMDDGLLLDLYDKRFSDGNANVAPVSKIVSKPNPETKSKEVVADKTNSEINTENQVVEKREGNENSVQDRLLELYNTDDNYIEIRRCICDYLKQNNLLDHYEGKTPIQKTVDAIIKETAELVKSKKLDKNKINALNIDLASKVKKLIKGK